MKKYTVLCAALFMGGFLQADQAPTANPDGSKTIHEQDGTTIQLNSDGTKFITRPDGTTIEIKPDGTKSIKEPNGTTIDVKPGG